MQIYRLKAYDAVSREIDNQCISGEHLKCNVYLFFVRKIYNIYSIKDFLTFSY